MTPSLNYTKFLQKYSEIPYPNWHLDFGFWITQFDLFGKKYHKVLFLLFDLGIRSEVDLNLCLILWFFLGIFFCFSSIFRQFYLRKIFFNSIGSVIFCRNNTLSDWLNCLTFSICTSHLRCTSDFSRISTDICLQQKFCFQAKNLRTFICKERLLNAKWRQNYWRTGFLIAELFNCIESAMYIIV